MTSKSRMIEVDEATADALQVRAAERGVSVSALVTELANYNAPPLSVAPDEIVELDRRWTAVEAGGATVPNHEVVRWLDSWGTPAFRRWHDH